MKLFEDVWAVKGSTYMREYDTDLKKSTKTLTPYKDEYYIEDPMGKYKGFLDSKPLRKVLGSSFKINNAYGEKKATYVSIREDHFGKNTFNKSPGTFFLDIETSVGTQPGSKGFPNPEEALEPVVLIQFWDTTSNKGYVLGLEEWYNRKDYSYDFDLEYIKCDSEKELLEKYISLFQELDPFIIYAWNGNNFDFPYLFSRFKRVGIPQGKLSNHGTAKIKVTTLKNGQTAFDVITQGHQYLDLMEIYKKFVFKNVPSYSLDYIGELETGNKKINHDNYIKFDDFRIGKYVITGKETKEQKNTLLHKCAIALTNNLTDEKQNKYKKYIKEKSYSNFVDYGVRDFVLLKGIHDAQNFTQLMTTMASDMGCLLQDTLGTLKAWDAYITSYIAQNNLIAPPHQRAESEPNVVGGFVRDPEIGKHEWILSSDVTSMYPLLGMAAFNMSPETFIHFNDRPKEVQELNKLLGTQDEDKILQITENEWAHIKKVAIKYNVSMGIGGAVYHKEHQGVIPKLVTDIYKGRKIAKKEMFRYEKEAIVLKENGEDYHREDAMASLKDTEQMAAKISINSLYGALAAKYFSMYNESIAQSITGSGRFFIKMLANNIEDKLQSMIKSKTPYIVAGDTDSVYFQIAEFVKKYNKDKSITEKTKWADAFYKKVINPIVENTISQLADKLNAFDASYISADREIIADAGIFVAKKKYTARVRDNEGKIYPEDAPYLKVQGLEIIQGGTAPFAKKYLKEAIPVLLDKSKDEILSWIGDVRADYLNWPLDDIAKTQGVSKVENPEWGTIKNNRKVSIPFGSRVCVVTNNYIKDNNLSETYPIIDAGEKVKILYLLQPNKLKSDAFAFIDVRLAEQFKNDIDYDTTFYKFFLKPLEGMLKAIKVDVNDTTEELEEW